MLFPEWPRVLQPSYPLSNGGGIQLSSIIPIALPIFLEPPVVEIEGGLPKVIVGILNQYLSNQLSTYELGNLIEKVRMDRLIANNSKAIM